MKRGAELISNGQIILSGMVVSDDEAGWYYADDPVICPQMVREALAEISGAVTIRLCSIGGDPFAGEVIRSMLATHSQPVTVIVEGIAASAASLLYMGAAHRVMTAGSLIMIHDPSSMMFGNEAELIDEAARLGYLANTYAAVYAKAAGITAAAAREIMKAETWLNVEEAIAAGFAHEVLAENAQAAAEPAAIVLPEAVMAAKAQFTHMLEKRTAMRASQNSPKPNGLTIPTAAAGGVMANLAATMETNMPDNTPAAAAAPQPTMAAAAVDPQAIAAAALANARAVRMMAQPFIANGLLTQADVDAEIDAGTPANDAGQRFMTKMAAAQPAQSTPRGVSTITVDETDTKIEGMIGALMGQTEGIAAPYRGMRLKSLATHLAGPRQSFHETQTVRAGMVSTTMMGGAVGVSDFSYITTAVMNRTLQAEYTRRAATWQLVCGTPLNASDFRAIAQVRMGGDFQLKKVLANGEYKTATLKDEGSTLQVERRGATINLTFEAIINDDMGALSRIPMEFAMAARIMENSMVWDIFRKNAAMSVDGVALFHATHGNLAGTAAAISVTSVSAGRKAMWEQRVVGSKDPDDFMQIEPNRLIVPPALELPALQFAGVTTPNADGSVNPFKASLTPAVVPNLGASAGGSDTAWYLISSDAPPIAVAYLDGYAAPTVQTVEGMNPDLVTMNARHIFGAASTDYRGAYKNAGV